MNVKDIIGKNSEWIPNRSYDDVKPLITVILPTYSRAKSGLLKRCIDSILKQSFRRLELIIVIDGSTDGTLDICKKYMETDSRVNIIWHSKNMGLPAISTYEAYLKARGDYMAYAFDDNVWELNALAQTFDFMEEHEVKASFGITRVTDPISGQTIEFGKDGNAVKDTLWAANSVGAGSVVLHREVLETVGLHDPHLSLTRVCDWDLWLRVSERYDFVATGILFTFEHGTTQPDSLGNMFKLDQWFFRERQQHRDLTVLLPENYERADVISYSLQNSAHYMRCLLEHYKQYTKKVWFSNAEYSAICDTNGDKRHRYIVVCARDHTASIMNFTRNHQPNITICYVLSGNLSHSVLVMADMVVLVRIMDMPPVNSMCKGLNIPCYYFTDDNFREIVVDHCEDFGSMEVAKKTNRKYLSRFTGILVTAPALKSYFLENNLHSNVILLPAIWREPSREAKESERLTIAFMGGPFREETLKKCVLPALYRISKDRPLRLICPCTPETKEKTLALEKNNLEIVPFYRTSNYEYLINAYAALKPDLLIHCGNNLRNNIYKTKNALINAVSLGAPLLVSDIEPYCDQSDGSESAYLLTRNTPEEWEKALQRLVGDASLRHLLFVQAKKFCKEHYSSETVWKEMNQELEKLPTHELFFYLKRYEQVCDWMILHGFASGLTTGNNSEQRAFIPEELSYTGELGQTRRFGFSATKEVIREIGLLFAVSGTCSGTVELAFYKRGHTEPETVSEIMIGKLVKNGYTNILLGSPITAELGELLFIDITVHYEEKNGFVGLFEDRKNRTFIYKVFNKLRRPIPGRDAIFIDCRS